MSDTKLDYIIKKVDTIEKILNGSKGLVADNAVTKAKLKAHTRGLGVVGVFLLGLLGRLLFF